MVEDVAGRLVGDVRSNGHHDQRMCECGQRRHHPLNAVLRPQPDHIALLKQPTHGIRLEDEQSHNATGSARKYGAKAKRVETRAKVVDACGEGAVGDVLVGDPTSRPLLVHTKER